LTWLVALTTVQHYRADCDECEYTVNIEPGRPIIKEAGLREITKG